MTNNYGENDRLISKGNKQFETYLSQKFSPKIAIGNNPSFWIFPSLFYDVRYVLFRRLYLLRFTWALCRITCNCCHYDTQVIYKVACPPLYTTFYPEMVLAVGEKLTWSRKLSTDHKSHKRTTWAQLASWPGSFWDHKKGDLSPTSSFLIWGLQGDETASSFAQDALLRRLTNFSFIICAV